MVVMGGRIDALKYTLLGLEKYKLPLLSSTPQGLQFPFDGWDDMGIYYFVPLLAYHLGINTVVAYSLFWTVIISIALLIGLTCICMLFKNWPTRLLAAYLLCGFSTTIFGIGDVYIAAPAITMSAVPASLYFFKKCNKHWAILLFTFLLGIALSTFHYLRSNSELAILIFALLLIVFNKITTLKFKSIAIGLLAVGFILPILFFQSTIETTNNYLIKNVPNYHPTLNQHPLWHSVYIGLGFLPNNPYHISWKDAVAAKRVEALTGKLISYNNKNTSANNIVFSSPLYEKTLRNEVFRITKENPLFILHTLTAKAAVILESIKYYLIIALLLTVFFPKGLVVESAMLALLLISALPGLLTIPEQTYISGFTAAALIYMLISIGHALEKIKLLSNSLLTSNRKLLISKIASIFLIVFSVSYFFITTIHGPVF